LKIAREKPKTKNQKPKPKTKTKLQKGLRWTKKTPHHQKKFAQAMRPL
jgi:hypothetical protein